MKRLLRKINLPLLEKDLIEIAARRRTYVFRVLFALGFCAFFFPMLLTTLAMVGADPLRLLGRGQELFWVMVNVLGFGIVLFLPPMVAASVAGEKERNTLTLVLASPMTPLAIVTQKLISRLIPMFSLLLLSMPLMAFAYSLGGVSPLQLGVGIGGLAGQCLFVGSFAMMFSCACGSTVSATVRTYVWGLLLTPVLGCCSPLIFSPFGPGSIAGAMILGGSFSLALALFVWLPIAVRFLVRRGLDPPKSFFGEFLSVSSGRRNRMKRLRHSPAAKTRAELPDERPLAWWQTRKTALGRLRNLVIVAFLLDLPVLIFVIGMLTERQTYAYNVWFVDDRRPGKWGGPALMMLWSVALLLVPIIAAQLVSEERTRQRLQDLLVTPMTGADFLRQKMAGLRRLSAALCVPLVTIFLFELYWQWSFERGPEVIREMALYALSSALSLAVYLPLIGWLSLLIGLRVRSAGRAVVLALAACIGWAAVTLFLSARLPFESWPALFVSPAVAVVQTEMRTLSLGEMLLNYAFYGGLLWGIRSYCLSRADVLLGRPGLAKRSRVARWFAAEDEGKEAATA